MVESGTDENIYGEAVGPFASWNNKTFIKVYSWPLTTWFLFQCEAGNYMITLNKVDIWSNY